MIYRPKHFALHELVGPAVFAERGERAWELLRPGALMALDALREKFGPITVNNWKSGGQYKESGLRDFGTSTGAKYSMHKYGGAFDCKFKDYTPKEVAAYILAHPQEFPTLTCIENPDSTPTWLHIDDRNHGQAGIWVVNP